MMNNVTIQKLTIIREFIQNIMYFQIKFKYNIYITKEKNKIESLLSLHLVLIYVHIHISTCIQYNHGTQSHKR